MSEPDANTRFWMAQQEAAHDEIVRDLEAGLQRQVKLTLQWEERYRKAREEARREYRDEVLAMLEEVRLAHTAHFQLEFVRASLPV